VTIGDRLHRNRYSVIRKLGWGVFSTVWLCLDNKSHDYVAIKIVKACPNYREVAIDEIEMLLNIRRADVNDPFGQRVVTLLDHFKLRGINGKRKYFYNFYKSYSFKNVFYIIFFQ